MSDRDALDAQERDYYGMLDALDTKAAGLLQIAAIWLVVLFLENFKQLVRSELLRDIAIYFLCVGIIPHFYILWFKKHPKRWLVQSRIYVFNISVVFVFVAIVLSLLSTGFFGLFW